MDGINIISKMELMHTVHLPYFAQVSGITAFLFIICALLLLVIGTEKGFPYIHVFLIIGLLFSFVVCVVFCNWSKKEPTGKYQYLAFVEKNVTVNDICKKYIIISSDGCDQYTLVDR